MPEEPRDGPGKTKGTPGNQPERGMWEFSPEYLERSWRITKVVMRVAPIFIDCLCIGFLIFVLLYVLIDVL